MDFQNEAQFEKNLISVWFEEMKTVPIKHYEPILDENVVALIKQITLTLSYNDDVFVMSVQVLEEFIRRKDKAATVIDDPILSIFCVIFICGKYDTSKLKYLVTCETLQRYLLAYTGKIYDLDKIRSAERDILKVLKYEIPKNTKTHDLNTMYMYFVHTLKVKDIVVELFTELLNVFVLFWPTIYAKLRSIYSGTELKEAVLKSLLSHRCYVPSGILLTGMGLIKLFNVLDKKKIGMEFQGKTGIHLDHLQLLSDILRKIVNKKSNKSLFATK